MWHGILHGVQQALHGNEKTYASHPARVKAQIFRVLASYPNGLLAAVAISLIGAALLLLLPFDWLPVTATVAGAPLIWFFAYVTEIRPWFREGHVCPGVVVCEDPFLVASITDMTTDLPGRSGMYPAIKIRREPRRRFSTTEAKRGRGVASVARYSGFPGLKPKYWIDFEPRAVQCPTSKALEVQRLLREIPSHRWQQLEEALDRIPRPYRPGLYRLWEMRK